MEGNLVAVALPRSGPVLRRGHDAHQGARWGHVGAIRSDEGNHRQQAAAWAAQEAAQRPADEACRG